MSNKNFETLIELKTKITAMRLLTGKPSLAGEFIMKTGFDPDRNFLYDLNSVESLLRNVRKDFIPKVVIENVNKLWDKCQLIITPLYAENRVLVVTLQEKIREAITDDPQLPFELANVGYVDPCNCADIFAQSEYLLDHWAKIKAYQTLDDMLTIANINDNADALLEDL